MVRWNYYSQDGAAMGASAEFDARATAEGWLGSEWEALLDQGVETVALVDASSGHELYRMPLGEDG